MEPKWNFLYISKISLRILYLVTVIMILRHIMWLKGKSWKVIKAGLFNNKYILLWTDSNNIPFIYMGKGRSVFTKNNCEYTNCIVTDDKSLLSDIRKFDVIVFHGPDLFNLNSEDLPNRRLHHQKYVFASIESSDNYPLCTRRFDGYFNWTWTYRLESEVRWGYIVIRDSKGVIIGPSKNMDWLDPSDMQPVNNETKSILKKKTKAVAWFVSNCMTKSRREGYVRGLQKYLYLYGLEVDIYGDCGPLECPRSREEECNKMIEKDYYFYLAFENAFSEDYVTEKVLLALRYNTIPIVYGGADYSRFLPPNSYLNARELGVYELGELIYTLMQDPEMYASYFKWQNHYSYNRTKDSPDTNEYCQMCALLNDEKKMKEKFTYERLEEWWDPPNPFC